MSYEGAVFDLLSNAGSDASDRFYPRRFPPNVTLPAGIFYETARRDAVTRDRGSSPDSVGSNTAYYDAGADNLKRVTYRVELFGKTYEDPRAIKDQLRPKLVGFNGTADGETISNIMISGGSDQPLNQSTDFFVRAIDLVIWFA